MCILKDEGSNFFSGLNRAGVTNATCLVHNLQHAINDGVLAQKDIQDLLAAGRRTLGDSINIPTWLFMHCKKYKLS